MYTDEAMISPEHHRSIPSLCVHFRIKCNTQRMFIRILQVPNRLVRISKLTNTFINFKLDYYNCYVKTHQTVGDNDFLYLCYSYQMAITHISRIILSIICQVIHDNYLEPLVFFKPV